MSDMFQPGQTWEMRYDDSSQPFIFYLIEKLPPQDNGPRFGVSRNTWEVIILESSSVHTKKPGERTRLQLDGVSFRACEDLGYDGYDNTYERLA